ncbi:hypothetical protein BJ165DRAFT_1596323 [Panaeolus papilionaceus]|nr:hypothetical protein BJ165DRAFT_1596323 [Panaeolus papilionaceus]
MNTEFGERVRRKRSEKSGAVECVRGQCESDVGCEVHKFASPLYPPHPNLMCRMSAKEDRRGVIKPPMCSPLNPQAHLQSPPPSPTPPPPQRQPCIRTLARGQLGVGWWGSRRGRDGGYHRYEEGMRGGEGDGKDEEDGDWDVIERQGTILRTGGCIVFVAFNLDLDVSPLEVILGSGFEVNESLSLVQKS